MGLADEVAWKKKYETKAYSSNDIPTEAKIKAELEQINNQIAALESRKRLLENGIYIEPIARCT